MNSAGQRWGREFKSPIMGLKVSPPPLLQENQRARMNHDSADFLFQKFSKFLLPWSIWRRIKTSISVESASRCTLIYTLTIQGLINPA